MSLRFLADEDLDSDIVDGLRLREPAIDLLDVKESDLRGTSDVAYWRLRLSKDESSSRTTVAP